MTAPRHDALAPRRERDRGLSIVELVLTVVVLGIVVGAGAAAVISLLRSNETVTARTTVARGTRQLVSHLPADVRSARVADIRSEGFDTTCLGPADAAGQIGLQIDIVHADGSVERATYVSVTDPGDASAELWRVSCTRPPGGSFIAERRTSLAGQLDPTDPFDIAVHTDGRVRATLRPLVGAPQVVQAQAMLPATPSAPTTAPTTTVWTPPTTTTTPLNVASATYWLDQVVDVRPGTLAATMTLNGPESRWVELTSTPIELETNPDRVHIWATRATVGGPVPVVGPVVLHLWTTSATGTNAPGHGVTAALLDCPAVSSFTTTECTLLGTASASSLSVGPDVRTLNFGNLTATVAAGNRLVLKVGAHSAHAAEGFTLHWGPPILPMAHLASASRLVIG